MKDLKLFIQPDILQRIGARRLGKLLRPFAPELQAINFPMPPPDEPDQNHYFHNLAAAIARSHTLPQSLLKTLLTLETAAAPENSTALGNAIKSRVPYVSLPPDFVIDHALEVWLVAPEELARFAPPDEPPCLESKGSDEQGRSSSPSPLSLRNEEEEDAESVPTALPPTIENQKSEIENLPASAPAVENQNSKIENSFARLARLSSIEYDLVRRAEAKRLNLRVSTLDDAVERARILEDDAQANALKLPQLEPWPQPITDAPTLFDDVHDRCLLYLHLPPGAAVVLTLWPAHAQAIKAFTLSPRLNFTSIEPGCGKTTALDFLATLTPNVLRTDNLKTAVLFRVVEQQQPTLLLDELDSYLHLFPELRGLINSGHSDSGYVHRCEGNVVRAFKSFAATALAGIGDLASTLRDRSIIIALSKAPPGVLKARFDKRHVETETILGRKIARWVQDNFAAIAACDPVMPAAAHNRLGDNWRPLFAIAQLIGAHWPQRLGDAFEKLTLQPQNDPAHLQILAAIRTVFQKSGALRLFTADILHALNQDSNPNGHGNGHTPLNETRLGSYLKNFGVRSRNTRIAGRQAKGYHLADLTPLFTQFLNRQTDALWSPDI